MNEKTINNWISIAEYDIQTSFAMLESGRYLYVAYTAQQCVEKIIKAYFVKLNNQTPPYIHNLIRLLQLTNLGELLNEKQIEFISELNAYYIESRYTEDLKELAKQTDKFKAEEIYHKTVEIFNWIKKKI